MLRLTRIAAAASTSLILAAGSIGLTVATAGGAAAATVNTPLPAHVFSPYWEAYSGDDPLAESQASGDKYLTAAFLQTASAGSCTAYWNGSSSQPISSSTWGSDFATIQADGGNVIPSFGGYTADHDGTDIADSCTNVSSIAAAYESVITTYNVTRIDLDIEDNSLTDTAGITRRNQAVAQVESWAAANNRSIQFSYTMPSDTTGLSSTGLAVLQNAKTEGATVSVVNIMTFDYYIGTQQEMATDTESAGQGLYSQLQSLYPSDTSAQLWGMIGITEMPGIDDFGTAETFTQADAGTVLAWAESKGISTLSFWALERDNGGCVGTGGQDSCSGIAQPTWYFSNTFAPFTSGTSTTPPTNGFSVSVSPSSARPSRRAQARRPPWARRSPRVRRSRSALSCQRAPVRRDGDLQPEFGHRGQLVDGDVQDDLGHGERLVPDHDHRHGRLGQPVRDVHADRHRRHHQLGRLAGQRQLRDRQPEPVDLPVRRRRADRDRALGQVRARSRGHLQRDR